MGFTKADLERMRSQRKSRIADNKAAAAGDYPEYLLEENLAKGSSLWFPKEPEEVLMRVVPFMSEDGSPFKSEPGSFHAARIVALHVINKRRYICPTTFGDSCPYCDRYNAAPKEQKAKQDNPITRLKASNVILFNALFKVPKEGGGTNVKMRVVRGGKFFTWDKIMSAIDGAAKLTKDPKLQDRLFLYDDFDEGYFFETGFAKAPAVQGNKKEFMQIISCRPLHKEAPIPIGEKVAITNLITNLDMLVPPAPTHAQLKEWLGSAEVMSDPEEHNTEEHELDEGGGLDIDGGISFDGTTDIPGEEAVTVSPVPPSAPVAAPKAPAPVITPVAPVPAQNAATAASVEAEITEPETSPTVGDNLDEEFDDLGDLS
jgi:hypothetical protein